MFRLIRPETLPDVSAALAALAQEAGNGSSADVRASDADAAASRVRADYGRASRWGMGILATAGALVSILLLGFAASVVETGHDLVGDLLFAGFVLFIAAAFAVPSIWMLIALHRSGRTLTTAAAYWSALPYRQGRRTPTRGDWFAVRFLSFSSDLFPRLLTSVVAALATIFFVSIAVYAIVEGQAAWQVITWAASAILLGAVSVGQFGGVQRLQNAYLARDPWKRSR